MEPWQWVVMGVALAVMLRGLMGGRASAAEVRQKIAAGAKIVDVRSPEEFKGGAYPGAVNIPVHLVGARLADLAKDKPVVVYCASGLRSAQAATVLKKAGYDVVNAGGLASMPR